MSVDPQTRILNHMNKDHKIAIEDYLCVYGNVTINDKIANIKMKDIEFDHFTIEFNHRDIEFEILKPIPFDPPLNNWSEAREVLVKMAKEAASKRGYSHVQIKDIIYPTDFMDLTLLSLIVLVVTGYFDSSLVFDKFFPLLNLPSNVINFLKNYNNLILYITFLLHLFETVFVLTPKLIKYRVPIDFRIEWILFNLLLGFPMILKFNSLVESALNPTGKPTTKESNKDK